MTKLLLIAGIIVSVLLVTNHKLPGENITKTVPQPKASVKTVIIATGDIVPGRSVNYQIHKFNNYSWPFENVKAFLKSGDITIVNMEAPLIKNCPLTVEGMVFCGDERNIQGMIESGVDIANLANNHISDQGIEGINNTVSLLESADMSVTGLDMSKLNKPSRPTNLLIREVNNIKFGFLGYNDISGAIDLVMPADLEAMSKEVSDAKKRVDVLIVSIHWGAEYRSEPDSRQIELANALVQAGADLILGNHPHWIQPGKYIGGAYVKYAHGNFVFDQMWSEETKKGEIGKYTFEGLRLVDVEFIPIYIKDYGQPVLQN